MIAGLLWWAVQVLWASLGAALFSSMPELLPTSGPGRAGLAALLLGPPLLAGVAIYRVQRRKPSDP